MLGPNFLFILYHCGESLHCNLRLTLMSPSENFLIKYKTIKFKINIIKILPDMRSELISISGSLSLLYSINIRSVFWKLDISCLKF